MNASRFRTRGVATVEFAIAVPLLLFLIFAVSELGRAFVQYTVLANAVRDAARYLAGQALLGTTGTVSISNTLRTQTQNLVVYGNVAAAGQARLPSLTTGHVTVTNAGGGNITVNATYPYQPLFSSRIPAPGLQGTAPSTVFNMQIVVTMRAI